MRGNDYKKWTADLHLPPRKWVRLGSVKGVDRGVGLYVCQVAFKQVDGGWLQLRLKRQPANDGTGDQDYMIPKGLSTFNVTHMHACTMHGKRGTRMEFWACLQHGGVAEYRILKAQK